MYTVLYIIILLCNSTVKFLFPYNWKLLPINHPFCFSLCLLSHASGYHHFFFWHLVIDILKFHIQLIIWNIVNLCLVCFLLRSWSPTSYSLLWIWELKFYGWTVFYYTCVQFLSVNQPRLIDSWWPLPTPLYYKLWTVLLQTLDYWCLFNILTCIHFNKYPPVIFVRFYFKFYKEPAQWFL